MKSVSQSSIILDYFKKNPNRNINHPEVVDRSEKKYTELTGKKLRDPDRAIRKLHQEGLLIKVEDGVYKYDPRFAKKKILETFSPKMKEKIFKRDDYKCVQCGKGKKNGIQIHADHIMPMDFGGKATLNNGQTLCGQHNYLKKNLKQTETGKKMFIRLYELSKEKGNKPYKDFCKDILTVFDKHNINGHIEWDE